MLTIKPHYFSFFPGDKVLDLGCGDGRHVTGLIENNPDLNVIGLDINFDDLKKATEKLANFYPLQKRSCNLVNSNGLNLPFSDNSFDHIICSEVLEHVHQYEEILSEIYRVLKPAGKLCVSVPRAWPERICWYLRKEYYQVEGGHVRIFNADKLRKTITGKNFTFTQRHWAHALHSPYWWLKCLFWDCGNNFFLVNLYHRFLVWDLMKKPIITAVLEKALNPLMGKSVVLYFSSLKKA